MASDRWTTSSPGTTLTPSILPYGQSLLIAAESTLGISSAGSLADKRRDHILSRTAGIDAAITLGDVDFLVAPMGAAAKYPGKAGAPTLVAAGKLVSSNTGVLR